MFILVIPWGIVMQFIPSLTRVSPSYIFSGGQPHACYAWFQSYIGLHWANGYALLFLIPTGVASGWVLARRALGGEPATQAIYYVLGLLIFVAGTLGMLTLRDPRQHRKWMLRESFSGTNVYNPSFKPLLLRHVCVVRCYHQWP